MEPQPSSNGLPWLSPKLVPYLLLLVSAAGVVSTMYPGTVAAQVAGVVTALGGVLGIASPGWRKALPDVPKAEAEGQAAGAAVDSQAKAVDVLKGK